MDRARELGSEMNCTAKTWRTPTPQPELFQLFEEEPGAGRPGSVTDPAPKGLVVRHACEHVDEICPYVDSRRANAADGGSGGGGAADVRRVFCRAGYRSAHDLFFTDGARIFTGGHCRASPRAEGSSGTGGADRGQSSSSGSAGGREAEVLKVHEQDRVQQ